MSGNKTLTARKAAHESWAKTADRAERTSAARRNGPASLDYWEAKLDPERFAIATPEQRRAAAESLRKAHYVDLQIKSARARKGGK